MILDTRFRQAIGKIKFLLLGSALVRGCASKGQFRKSIRTVSIAKDVKVPRDMVYFGPEETTAILLGGVGLLVGQAFAKRAKVQLNAAMLEAQIDLAQILREQFQVELTKVNAFPLIVTEGGDAEFRLEVRAFGFIMKRTLEFGFTRQLRFMLIVNSSLVRRDDTALWKNFKATEKEEQIPEYTLEEFLQNPQLIRETFTAAAKFVSTKLLEDMDR